MRPLFPAMVGGALCIAAALAGPRLSPVEMAAAAPIDGATEFKAQCAVCHQPNGEGVAGQFPPLAGNRDLFLSRTFPVMVVLAGLSGSIEVEGQTLNSTMPPLDYLSDAQVAAVLNYVRGAWGNDKLKPAGMAPLEAATVAEIRKRKIPAEQVYAKRKQLKAAQK